jgi:hypothetical protein
MSQIALLITLCSNKQDWKELKDIDFVNQLLDGIYMTISFKHPFKIYLGYDENDEFFASKHNELVKRYPNCDISVLPKKCNGNPCLAWNLLLKKAFENKDNKYFYQVGSDIVHTVKAWDDYFITLMKRHNDDIICGGVDMRFWCERAIRDQAGILENVFFSRNHYERFGFLFPPEVKNWFSDDIITKIYRNVDRCYICPNIKYQNVNRVGGSNEKSRYVPPEKEEIAKNWDKIANQYTIEGFPEFELKIEMLNSLSKYN